MAWPQHWVRPYGCGLYVGDETTFQRIEASEFLAVIEETGSLRALSERFPASRAQLLAALAHVGFDFSQLLRQQMKQGMSDRELARLHRLDAKWVARERELSGLLPQRGRPTPRYTDEEIVEVYGRCHNNCSAAARELGIDRGTFHARYQRILSKRRDEGRV